MDDRQLGRMARARDLLQDEPTWIVAMFLRKLSGGTSDETLVDFAFVADDLIHNPVTQASFIALIESYRK